MKRYEVTWVTSYKENGGFYLKSGSTIIEAKNEIEAEREVRRTGVDPTGTRKVR